jgi:hypothetical protein
MLHSRGEMPWYLLLSVAGILCCGISGYGR